MLKHQSNRTPSVLLICTDQQRWDAVGWANPLVHTPHLDRLAAGSVRCRHAYAASPQCQPSRASVLTGKYPTTHQVWWNWCELEARHQTLPAYLPGYRTAWFGKLDVLRPHQFDYAWTTEDWNRAAAPGHLREFHAPMGTPTWTGELSLPPAGFHEEMITELALSWLGQHSHEPFFLGVSYYGPHPPYAAPAAFSGLYPDPPVPPHVGRGVSHPNNTTRFPHHVLSVSDWVELKRQYWGLVSWIDSLVGRLLEAVAGRDDLVIVFTSDHGDILGDHGLFSKGLYAYEGNTRVPLLVHAPGLPPRDYEHLVSGVDLLPTLLGLLGLPGSRELQGVDLTEHLRAGTAGRQSILSCIGLEPRLRCVVSRRYGRRWKYWQMGEGRALFDLDSDPLEERNLAGAPDLRAEELAACTDLVELLIAAEDRHPRPVRAG